MTTCVPDLCAYVNVAFVWAVSRAVQLYVPADVNTALPVNLAVTLLAAAAYSVNTMCALPSDVPESLTMGVALPVAPVGPVWPVSPVTPFTPVLPVGSREPVAP